MWVCQLKEAYFDPYLAGVLSLYWALFDETSFSFLRNQSMKGWSVGMQAAKTQTFVSALDSG